MKLATLLFIADRISAKSSIKLPSHKIEKLIESVFPDFDDSDIDTHRFYKHDEKYYEEVYDLVLDLKAAIKHADVVDIDIGDLRRLNDCANEINAMRDAYKKAHKIP